MLLCVLLCLSPDVIFLIGVVVGDGVGNIAGADKERFLTSQYPGLQDWVQVKNVI